MSKVMRSVKNVTKGYTSVQVKVREATSNDPWGPTGQQMSEIAQLTFSGSTEFYEIVDMLDKRLNDKGKNWRHVLKALKVLDYCLHEGSELVVTWARQNVFIIKTLREFQHIDDEGRDVGQNVRVAAKELTALILDEERLRAERSDRRSWKSRVHGLDEHGPPQGYNGESSRPRPRRRQSDDDAEYRLAIEASKAQEEEDRRRREGRARAEEDDDLAKAIQLSKEEEERRRKELEESNAALLFDDSPVQTTQQQPAFTGFNQGYQQGQPVDFFANPIDQSQLQIQPTGYVQPLYTGYQPAGYPNGFQNGVFDPYQQQQQQVFQVQPTGYNPYAQPQPEQPAVQPGSNNPWATANAGLMAQKPTPTGSNNPFASSSPFGGRPAVSRAPTLSALPEQKTLSSFSTPPPTSFSAQPKPAAQPPPQQPQRELSEHEARLNALLASGEGMDTFGNTGQLRIPAQHTAPGTFVNSAGAGISRLTASATGAPAANPFLRTQFTGLPAVNYPAATGPAGGSTSNPFSGAGRGQQGPQGDLIQL